MTYALEYQRDEDTDVTRVDGLTKTQAESRARRVTRNNDGLLAYVLCGLPNPTGHKCFHDGLVDHVDGDYR